MDDLFPQLAECILRGKVDREHPHPPELVGSDGAVELTRKLLDAGQGAKEILAKGLMPGMQRIGELYERREAFLPELLISAQAMKAATALLKPYFQSGQVAPRGTFLIGTVAGDIHNIGKNVVAMVMEGNGWEVVDLGVEVPTGKFIEAVNEHHGCVLGMSALLTTTIAAMESSVREVKAKLPETRIFVGGSPVSREVCDRIGADGYFPDPHGLARHLSG